MDELSGLVELAVVELTGADYFFSILNAVHIKMHRQCHLNGCKISTNKYTCHFRFYPIDKASNYSIFNKYNTPIRSSSFAHWDQH